MGFNSVLFDGFIIKHYGSDMDITNQKYIGKVNELHDITFMLSRAESEDDIYKLSVEGAVSKLGIDRLAIFILDGECIVRGTYGTDADGLIVNESKFITPICKHPFALEMLSSRIPMAFKNDIELQYNFESVGVGWNGYITLWDGAQPIGWIACDNLLSGEALSEETSNVLLMLSFIISQSIVRLRCAKKIMEMNDELIKINSRLSKAVVKMERLAFTDALTNIANRRGLERRINLELSKENMCKKTVSVINLDVDNFKWVNDSFGHGVGDECLKCLSHTLTNLFYGYDYIFSRYGGDEFVVIIMDIDENELNEISSLILQSIRKMEIRAKKDIVSITVSVGAIINGMEALNDYVTLINKADENLYLAKKGGKNKAVISNVMREGLRGYF